MQSEVTLALNEATGNERLITVDSKRFTIGRSPDNDLTIDNSNLSRRHAVIENFDGVIQISDCGSQNGTRVNGAGVTVGAVLSDGDVITLGGACDLEVRIGEKREPGTGNVTNATYSAPIQSYQVAVGAPPMASNLPAADQGARPILPQRQNHSSFETWFSVPVIAALSVVLILLVSGLLVVISKNSSSGTSAQRQKRIEPATNDNTRTEATVEADPSPDEGANIKAPGGDESGLPSADLIEKAAVQVMHRISSDDKSYSFSEAAIHDIRQKVREYKTSSSLLPALASLQRNSSVLAAQARREGIEPGLLIYAAFAQTDGGRTGMDPLATARAIMPDLIALKATFGVNDGDSSLILIAAYKMGRGEKRSHPLLATMRHLVKNPLTQRNVWYLNDKGGLDRRSYDFVVSFLALGVISQNPRQFGIPGDPLSF